MLSRIHIENLAIVEKAEIEFAPGLNALTGETGAGKSVIVGALELALGGRASADALRAGQKLAVAEATFEAPFARSVANFVVKQLGLEWENGETLVLRREISAQGRSRAFVAGQLVNAADLKTLGEMLVDLHGQHEHQSLFHLAAQRAALDAYGDYARAIEEYAGAHAEHSRLRRRQQELAEQARDFEKRLDFLDFQIGELEEAAPREGELAELESEEARLSNAESLAEAAQRAYALLYEGQGDEGASALAMLGEARRAAEQIADLDAEMRDLSEKFSEVEALVEDLGIALRSYASKCEADPERLETVVSRIEALRRLIRKHGAADEAALVTLLAELKAEREKMTRDESERQEIDAKLAQAAKLLEKKGKELFRLREETAGKLSRAVMKTLARVAMEKAVFEADVRWTGEFTADGTDRVEFLLAANPGEGKKPLRETASGGELSRTMLAIKTALAKRDSIPTLVFDEIDAGISGETAARVGKLMEELAASHQILCITHHAAIAARAGHHLSVRKSASGGRTQMGAVVLEGDERLEELARMMGGDAATTAGKKLAKELLAS
jgi:DNA repair protein RecN (Recombination protein N)